jgi:hypothetical protein
MKFNLTLFKYEYGSNRPFNAWCTLAYMTFTLLAVECLGYVDWRSWNVCGLYTIVVVNDNEWKWRNHRLYVRESFTTRTDYHLRILLSFSLRRKWRNNHIGHQEAYRSIQDDCSACCKQPNKFNNKSSCFQCYQFSKQSETILIEHG